MEIGQSADLVKSVLEYFVLQCPTNYSGVHGNNCRALVHCLVTAAREVVRAESKALQDRLTHDVRVPAMSRPPVLVSLIKTHPAPLPFMLLKPSLSQLMSAMMIGATMQS